MKTIVVVLILLFSSKVYADPVLLDWTGLKAEKFDYGFYIGGNAPNFIGGPAANNSLGGAWQFTVAAETKIDWLAVSGHAYTAAQASYDYDIYFKLYQGTDVNEHGGVRPKTEYFAANPWEVHIPGDHNANATFDLAESIIPFPVLLEPGDYWFAQERLYGESSGMAFVMPEVEFVDPPASLASIETPAAVAPEPITLALFTLGCAGIMLRRKFCIG